MSCSKTFIIELVTEPGVTVQHWEVLDMNGGFIELWDAQLTEMTHTKLFAEFPRVPVSTFLWPVQVELKDTSAFNCTP